MPTTDAVEDGMADKPLDEMTKPELIEYAHRLGLGITYIGQRSKPDILALIRECESQRASS